MTSDTTFHPAHRYSFDPRKSESSLPSYKTEDEVTATGDALPTCPPKTAAANKSNPKDLESGPAVTGPTPRTKTQTEAKPSKCEKSTAQSDGPRRLKPLSAGSIASLLSWMFMSIWFTVIALVTHGKKMDCNRKAENGNQLVRYRCTPANYLLSVAFAVCIFKASDRSLRALIRCTTKESNSGLQVFLSTLRSSVTCCLAIGAFAFMTFLPQQCFEDRCMEEGLCPDDDGHPIHGTICYSDLINGTEKY